MVTRVGVRKWTSENHYFRHGAGDDHPMCDPEKKQWERPRERWLGAHEIKDNTGVAGMSFTNFANIRVLTTQLEYHLHFKLAQRSHKNN